MIEANRDRILYTWSRQFGLEVDYHGSNLIRPAVQHPGEVIRDTDRIATGHPKAVRTLARRLSDSLDERHNSVDDNVGAEPSNEDFRR